MFVTALAAIAGATFGFVAAGPLAGALGGALGLMVGLLRRDCRAAAVGDLSDAVLVSDQQRLLCVPGGRIATATFWRDARNGRWLDVARCSLCNPEDHVACDKRCLVLVRGLPQGELPVPAPPGPTNT